MGKGKFAVKVLLGILLVAGVAGSVTLSAFNLMTLRSYITLQKEKEAQADADETEKTQEDYVVIADQYEIKPTTNISDAYKSGDTSNLTDKEKETLDMAKQAIQDMGITDSMTEFDKEKAVYDWMTSKLKNDPGALTVIPTTTQDCDNPYGVLKFHNAVCVGYATTFRMFMQMMDIECMIEHSVEKIHSWNVVKIDGDWYITDIYSDVDSGNYANFNVTNSMFATNQSWDQSYFPVADSLKYNMAYINRQTVDGIYDIPSALREAMNKRYGSVIVSFKEKITEENAPVAMAAGETVGNLIMQNNIPDMPYAINSYEWVLDPETNDYMYYVTFSSYNTTETNTNLTEEQIQKINDSVNNAFDDLIPETDEYEQDWVDAALQQTIESNSTEPKG